MKEATGLKGFMLKVEGMIHRGELQGAYRLLKNYVSQLPPAPATVENKHDYLEGCFWDNEEFFKFVADNRPNLKSLNWVEIPPVKAFYWLAYIASEWNDLDQALRYINDGLTLDASRPQMICEQGYILGGLHRPAEALDSYLRVTSARQWTSERAKARAFRGQGYALIELHRLDEAEIAFKESLKIQPDNELALNELRYIAEAREFERKNARTAAGEDPRTLAARAFAEAERIADLESAKGVPALEGTEPRRPKADEPLGRALALYEEALRLWRAAGDLAGQAQTLFGMGRLSALLWDIVKVMEYYHEAQHLWHQAGGHETEEALALYKLGSFTFKVGYRDKKLVGQALSYLLDALRLNRKVGETKGEVAVLMQLGEIHENLGEAHKAIGYYEQLLALKRAPDDFAIELQALFHIAKNYERLQEFDFALSYYTPTLSLAEREGHKGMEAVALYNIGSIHQILGNFDEALRYLDNALSVCLSAGHRLLAGVVLNGLGVTYYSRNEKQKALHNYDLSLKLRRELKDRRGEVATLRNMSIIYMEMEQWGNALDCFEECLKISRAEKNRQGEASALQLLGEICFRGNHLEKALECLEDALRIQKEIMDLPSQARTLTYLAYTCRELGDLTRARREIEAALTISESSRSKVFNPEWRASVLATSYNMYEVYVDLLLELGETVAAFEANERGRARSLLDLLAEAGADIRQGIDQSLLKSERELQQGISGFEEQRAQSLGAQAKQLGRTLADLRAQLQLVQARIRASSPRYAALVQPGHMNLEGIQRTLDAGTLFLEYALGQTRSHLWVISNRSVKHYQLPPRDEIESLADQLYTLLTARNISRETDTERQNVTLRLSRMLLEKPGAELRAAKRLVIVADGALQYIPFAALNTPSEYGIQAVTSARPLVTDYEIVYLPSASTLMVLRREMSKRQRAPRSVAVFADPVFAGSEGGIPRLEQNQGLKDKYGTPQLPRTSDSLVATLRRSAADVGLLSRKSGLDPLPATRDEAEAIFSLIGQDGGMIALGFDASRETLDHTDLTEYRIIHFATHGFANSEHPELSGVVLSLVNRMGEPQNGYLRLHDIYNLKLCAELVVLSACQTALGKNLKGEGLIGLTRGFMYAGSRRVLASLWEVDDVATAELMKAFYEGVRQNQGYAAALREAQLKLLQDQRWGSSPRYWAAFVMQGDWE